MRPKCRLIIVSCLLFVVNQAVQCQERITLYSSTGKNSLSFDKPEKNKAIKSNPVAEDNKQELTKTKNEETKLKKENEVTSGIQKEPKYLCPSKKSPKPLFSLSLPCSTTENCGFLGHDMLCCENRCVKGIKPPKTEIKHEPLLFGIIERKCPKDPLAELSDVHECFSDEECSPRICCSETLENGEKARYCRTPIPVWESLPLPSPVLEPLKTITGYMQCTPPPPPYLDLHPKPCENPLDCFPNLCCQEQGKKYCRPPRKSLLALVADLGQKIIPEETARKFIERIS
ncbi:uncharacterized protein LOC115889042 isoform X1 [Sitophilus oryzae]|uniref:Uncharacterized protein LOC115889042 isoform X1 n=1 Tax=Sitophilus oryzae TaxID=7048 RepID=A0A6J2YLE2_SITOR|nr:uncharacterized protein LOC115889042 isoform X1 [Sitophilus oryzae]